MKLDLQKEGQQEKPNGKAETKNEIAKKMKEAGADMEFIVKVTGLTKEEIEKL